MQARLGVSSAHGVSDGAGRGRSHRGPPPSLPLPQVPMAECSILSNDLGKSETAANLHKSRRRTRLSIFATERPREHICVAL